MTESHIRNVIEAALLAAGKPLQPADLVDLFDEGASRPSVATIQAALVALAEEYSTRGIEIKETATGFRIQVRRELSNEISRLWPERPPKYTRALLETLALIAYKQPITRAEIEAVRGVAVNPNILKSVIERNWVAVVGHRDVPGRPELLGTTREFLDYFGLKRLDELPPLAEIKALGEIKVQFDLPDPGQLPPPSEQDAEAVGSDAASSGSGAEKADGETVAAINGETSASAVASGESGESAAAEAVPSAAGDEGSSSQAVGTSGESASQGEDVSDESTTRGEPSSEGAGAVAEADDSTAKDAAGDSAAAEGAVGEGDGDPALASAVADASSKDAVTAEASADAAVDTSSAAVDGSGAAADGSGTTVEGAGATARGKRGKGRASRDASSESDTASDADTAATAEAADGDKSPENAGSSESAKKSSSSGRGSGRKTKRGKAGASDSALHEAEEFAASVDADLAAGDDDSSDEDELSAAGPDSSELVAGPRDIDE